MRIIKDIKFDFDDICLIPRVVSEVVSRKDINTSVKFCDEYLDVPIIGAPMIDVVDVNMDLELRKNGCCGIINRFEDFEKQLNEIKNLGVNQTFAIPIKDYDIRFNKLYNLGIRSFCIDTANGANLNVSKVIGYMQNKSDNINVIVGNVCSKENYEWLANLGAKAVRVGIAGGGVCSTKSETGVYYPMLSLLTECYEAKLKNNLDCQIIADGGIKIPADFCKAIGFGADVVMMGSILGATKESPAKIYKLDGKLYKVIRGSASYSVKESSGNNTSNVEGKEKLVEYQGKLSDVITKFKSGLQSCMSYFNAKNIKEFRNNLDYGIVQ